jgi:hypothetical protein
MARMKKLLIALVGLLAVASAHAADKGGTVVDQEITQLSKVLQARLPSLAMDGMCEAERESKGWNFSIRVKSDQGGSDEVQVIVREADGSRSGLRVQAVRVESSLITSKRTVNAALTGEWTEKILKLVAKAD